jgi:hypothetical protein
LGLFSFKYCGRNIDLIVERIKHLEEGEQFGDGLISQRRIERMRVNLRKGLRGFRYKHCLPCRGQRTQTNARTSKGRRRKLFEENRNLIYSSIKNGGIEIANRARINPANKLILRKLILRNRRLAKGIYKPTLFRSLIELAIRSIRGSFVTRHKFKFPHHPLNKKKSTIRSFVKYIRKKKSFIQNGRIFGQIECNKNIVVHNRTSRKNRSTKSVEKLKNFIFRKPEMFPGSKEKLRTLANLFNVS